MCKMKSFLCVRGETEPRWSDKHDSHSTLIQELGIEDKDHLKRDFVKIEFSPVNGNWFEPFDDWKFEIDEEGSVPAWFEEDKQLWHDRCCEVIAKKVLPLIAKGTFPGDLVVGENLKAKHLKKVLGSLDVRTDFKAPVLATVGGSLDVNADKTFKCPELKKVNGMAYKAS